MWFLKGIIMKTNILEHKLLLFSILLCLIVSFNGCSNDDDFYASIPDERFELALIKLGIDSDGLNGKVAKADIFEVTSLNIERAGITDLSGIEGFTSLTILYCGQNPITRLNLSQNKALKELYFSGTQITTLDLRKHPSLEYLYGEANPLINLDDGIYILKII